MAERQILDPLTNLEIVRYGNLIGEDWEGVSINDLRARIEREGLTPREVRDALFEAEVKDTGGGD